MLLVGHRVHDLIIRSLCLAIAGSIVPAAAVVGIAGRSIITTKRREERGEVDRGRGRGGGGGSVRTGGPPTANNCTRRTTATTARRFWLLVDATRRRLHYYYRLSASAARSRARRSFRTDPFTRPVVHNTTLTTLRWSFLAPEAGGQSKALSSRPSSRLAMAHCRCASCPHRLRGI